jgi:hypothetical protein
MDADRFDAAVRTLVARPSRRGLLAGLLASLPLALAVDQSDAKPRRGKHRRRRRGKPGKGCTPNCTGRTCGGNGCGGSCGTCGSGRTCENGTCVCRGTDCGDGRCCSSTNGMCCPETVQDPAGSCAQSGSTCCTSDQGGGACPAGRPQCCPSTPRNPRGLCLKPDEICCTAAEGGGWCGPANPVCCPPSNLYPRGTCCPTAESCCNESTLCTEGFTCQDGCCVAEPAGTAARSTDTFERLDDAERAKP